MNKLLGLVLIMAGFIAPYFTSGKLPSIFFFWVGFLTVLWPNKYSAKQSYLLKWARMGLLLNILGMLFLIFLTVILTKTSLSSNYFLIWLLQGGSLIFQPITEIVDFLLPLNEIILPDGSIRTTIGYFRATVTSFFDVLTYIFIGITLGKLIVIKQDKTQK